MLRNEAKLGGSTRGLFEARINAGCNKNALPRRDANTCNFVLPNAQHRLGRKSSSSKSYLTRYAG